MTVVAVLYMFGLLGKTIEGVGNMIAWIIYIIVTLILFFIIYIALLGINRGIKAKNIIKKNIIKNKEDKKKNF